MDVIVYLPSSLWQTTYGCAVKHIRENKPEVTVIKRWEDSNYFFEDFKDKQGRCMMQVQISKQSYNAFPVKMDNFEYVEI